MDNRLVQVRTIDYPTYIIATMPEMYVQNTAILECPFCRGALDYVDLVDLVTSTCKKCGFEYKWLKDKILTGESK